MEKLEIGKLNQMYSQAESADRELFSEMKSNVLMVSGKHWSNKSRQLWNRVKDARVDESQKVRVVKNHVARITRGYVNEILSQAPGVRVVPHNENELADQKAAEIANAVWQDAMKRHKLDKKIKDLVEDFIDLGEACIKIFWDPMKGQLVGYEQEVDGEGNPLFTDMNGQPTLQAQVIDPVTGMILAENQPMKSDRPVFSGDLVFETVLPFNLLRDPHAETMDEARWMIVRKMMDLDAAKALAKGDEDKLKFVQESAASTFKVFDGQKGDFVEGKNQVMVRELFMRPCHSYPNGRYILFTEHGILEEMDLPFGIWPLIWCGFQKIQTTPRAHSIIRRLRPFQASINQMASQQITHQLSIGDDKLIIQAGSKVERGGDMPGVRVLRVSGAPPTILPGRTGEQFVASLTATVDEMYRIADWDEKDIEINGQLDPNTLIFRSLRQKRKFSLYAETISDFLKETCLTSLKLAQKYYPDDFVVRAAGKREHVNIPEFKQIPETDFAFDVVEIGADIETMLGKSLQIQQVLQYVGKDLPPESRGQIIAAMPFLNGEQMFGDLTLDSKNVDNDLLALDRGDYVAPRKHENHKYIIKRLISRMKQRDFDLLSEDIKQNYERKIQEHEMVMAQEMAEVKAMQSQFIPSGGALIGVDMFVQMPNSSGGMKTVRARLPQEAVAWLIKQLETQGTKQEELLAGLPEGVQGELGQKMMMNQEQPVGGPSGAGPLMGQSLNMPTQGLGGF